MKPKITFQYFSGSRARPKMSAELAALILAAVGKVGASKCHIVHLGTVGDPRTHRPGTSHMQKPPEAIDVSKVFLKWPDGRAVDLLLKDSLPNRKLVRDVWESLGGKTAHAGSRRHGHIHLQTPREWW